MVWRTPRLYLAFAITLDIYLGSTVLAEPRVRFAPTNTGPAEHFHSIKLCWQSFFCLSVHFFSSLVDIRCSRSWRSCGVKAEVLALARRRPLGATTASWKPINNYLRPIKNINYFLSSLLCPASLRSTLLCLSFAFLQLVLLIPPCI